MKKYFVKVGDDKLGPFDFDRMKIMAESGTLHQDDYVSQDGQSWKVARYVPNLFTPSADIGIKKSSQTDLPVVSSNTIPWRSIVKLVLFTSLCCSLFAATITYVIMKTSAKKFAELTQKNSELMEKQDAHEKEFFESIPLKAHKDELAKKSLELEKKLGIELEELKKETNLLTEKLKDASLRLNEEDVKRQIIAKEYNSLMDSMKPFERLAKSYAKDDAFKELITTLNNANKEDFESMLRGLSNSTIKMNSPKALELRGAYRTLRTTISPNSAETFIRWNKMCKILLELGRDFKQTEPALTTYADIKSQKDLISIFIIRTLGNEKNANHLKSLVAASRAEDAVKEKSLIAIDEGRALAVEIVSMLGFDKEKYLTGILISKPGIEPKKMIEEVGGATFKFKQVFEAREPKRIEYHLETLSEITAKISKFSLNYSDNIIFNRDMKNELVKYGIFTILNTKLLDLESKESVKAVLRKEMVGWGNLAREELDRRMDLVFNDLELARIAGLLPNQ